VFLPCPSCPQPHYAQVLVCLTTLVRCTTRCMPTWLDQQWMVSRWTARWVLVGEGGGYETHTYTDTAGCTQRTAHMPPMPLNCAPQLCCHVHGCVHWLPPYAAVPPATTTASVTHPQAGAGLVGSCLGSGPGAAQRFQMALEESIARHFPGNHAINCMCHSSENFYRCVLCA
jgi:hypothetical protein